MKQVSNRKKGNKAQTKKVAAKKTKKKPLFGTSKLEEDFAKDFLDKLNVKYIYQFEAKSIGRWYDFYLQEHNLLIEIDGSYYHSDPRLVKEENMNPMQRHNKKVDEIKDKWALMHGIPIMRIWEKDIRENPNIVMDKLKERLYIEAEKKNIAERKNKRHVNKLDG